MLEISEKSIVVPYSYVQYLADMVNIAFELFKPEHLADCIVVYQNKLGSSPTMKFVFVLIYCNTLVIGSVMILYKRYL